MNTPINLLVKVLLGLIALFFVVWFASLLGRAFLIAVIVILVIAILIRFSQRTRSNGARP